MTGVKEALCRICRKYIIDQGFEVIDNVTRNMLDVLLLKLKICHESNEVICNACKRKLNTALEFKSTCLNMDNKIIPHVDCKEMIQFDLGEIYVKENGNLMGISRVHKICRLCMQLIKGEIRAIGEEELEAIHKFVPEMYISIIKDPVLCEQCFDSLSTYNTFLKNCSEVEQSIPDIFESSATESRTAEYPSDLFIKNEVEKESEIKEEEISIKSECVDIKSENEDEESDTLLLHSNNEAFQNSNCTDADEGLQCMWKHMYRSIEKCGMKSRNKSSLLYKCNKCIYESGSESYFRRHYMKHKKSLAFHVFQHKNLSQVQMYKCDACDYESRYKTHFVRHQLTHKDPSEVQMYHCKECNFKTKYKHSLALHLLRHKNSSEVELYKCDACDYESKYKFNITSHQLTHKDPMYQCDECNFKTKYKKSLAYHVLRHKDSSQVQMYKCDACDYESKYKFSFINHQLKHKDPAEVQMYHCIECNFKTKYKKSLAYHLLRHKNSSSTNV